MTTSTITRYPDPAPTAAPGDADRTPSIDSLRRKIAAVMFPLDRAEASGLQARLGPAWDIAEGRDCEDPDLVIVRPCSRQTIVGLRHRFPAARLIAIEPGADEPGLARGPLGLSVDVKDLSSAVAGRRSRPCRHRSARWRRRAGR